MDHHGVRESSPGKFEKKNGYQMGPMEERNKIPAIICHFIYPCHLDITLKFLIVVPREYNSA